MSASLSVVIPAYNEGARLRESLPTVIDYLTSLNSAPELIVVDDGSTDDTAKVAEKIFGDSPTLQTQVIRYEANRGKGYAVRRGLMASKAPIALFSDADLSTPISEIPKLIGPIEH